MIKAVQFARNASRWAAQVVGTEAGNVARPRGGHQCNALWILRCCGAGSIGMGSKSITKRLWLIVRRLCLMFSENVKVMSSSVMQLQRATIFFGQLAVWARMSVLLMYVTPICLLFQIEHCWVRGDLICLTK